jgi:periplasmic protein TonB
MAILPLGSSQNFNDNSRPWLARVFDNLRLAIHGTKLYPSVVNGAPLHFDAIDLSGQNGSAQTFSAGVHVAILVALFFAIASAPPNHPLLHSLSLGHANKLLPYIRPLTESPAHPSLGSDGSGGGRDSRSARFGNLAPESSMPLVPPRLVRNDLPVLPAPPAVFDPNAPANVTAVTNLGLPWMRLDTDSAGQGRGHGFGEGDGDTMGDGNGTGAGDGDGTGPYANVASPVTCLYCPQPEYTEEARKAKLQGKLLLQVLVGPDGRAIRVRLLQGLGMGLDESAVETVRGWRFSPGRDANKRPVPAWVTIETRFQLF